MRNRIILVNKDYDLVYDQLELMKTGSSLLNGFEMGEIEDIFKDVDEVILIEDVLDSEEINSELINYIKFLYAPKIIHVASKSKYFYTDSIKILGEMKAIDNDIIESLYDMETFDEEVIKEQITSQELIEYVGELVETNNTELVIENYPKIRYILTDYIYTKISNDRLVTEMEMNESKYKDTISSNKKLTTLNREILGDYNELKNKYNDLVDEYHALASKISWEPAVLNVDNYENAPIVIYIRDYEMMENILLYVKTLREAFELELMLSAKVLCVGGVHFRDKIKLIPNYFTVFADKVEVKELYYRDLVFKLGGYEKTLETLLKNELGLDVLIVLDMTEEERILEGRCLPLYSVSNERSMERLGLPMESTIFRDSEVLPWNLDSIIGLDIEETLMSAKLRAQGGIAEIVNEIKEYKGGEK